MKSIMTEKKYTKIYFRIFPMEKMIWDYLKILDDHRTIYVRCLQQLAKSKEHAVPTFWTFRSDNVFFNHTQKQIYNGVVPDVLDNISQGHDAILMAYGQTGTGKSLTINGLQSPYEDRGILPRIASDLINNVKAQATTNKMKMCIQVSYAEFSRTTVNDLLKSCPNHLDNLKDLVKMKVKTVEDAFRIIFIGEGRKTLSDKCPYPSHSCSSIFTFYIYTRKLDMESNTSKNCKLHVIDLAGADTVGNFSCLFKNPQEVGTGNLVKSQLEQFFMVLCSNIPQHIKVKQRLNPMIQYIGESIKKTTIFRFVGHIRVSREDLLITISMLRFGEIIGGLKATKYEFSIESEVSRERMDNLQKELIKLKLESTYNNILMHQDLAKSLSEERFAHIERTVNEYLQNKITQLTLLNVCDVNIALEILKMTCKKNEEKRENKDETSSATKVKKLSSGSQKVQSKSSRTSHRSIKSSSSEKMRRSMDRKTASSAHMTTLSKDKVPSLHETGSRKLKTGSSTSLIRKQSSEKRKSSSRISVHERSNDALLMDHIPPEYSEAWNLYTQERSGEYSKLVDNYRNNETAAKSTYRSYLQELDNLKGIAARVEKYRYDLFMAKMTKDFQETVKHEGGRMMLSEYEDCATKELQKVQEEQVGKQELILKYQAELKTYIKVCKEQKKALNDDFNAFCQEKYKAPIGNLEVSEGLQMNIEQALNQEKEKKDDEPELRLEDVEATVFERFKPLVEIEQRKKKKSQIKHREWLTY